MLGKIFSTFGTYKPKTPKPDPDYDRTMDDFVTTWMGAFYELCLDKNIDSDLDFDDATETLYEGFKMYETLTLDRIDQYSKTDVRNLAEAAKHYLGHNRLTDNHIRYLLEESLWNRARRPERPIYSQFVGD